MYKNTDEMHCFKDTVVRESFGNASGFLCKIRCLPKKPRRKVGEEWKKMLMINKLNSLDVGEKCNVCEMRICVKNFAYFTVFPHNNSYNIS